MQLNFNMQQVKVLPCKIVTWTVDSFVYLSWNLVGPNGVSDAVAAAKQCDIAIVVVGEDVNTCGEG